MTHALQVNELESARERLDMLKEQIARVYIGDPSNADMMLIALLARGHVLLEGVPGVAKTTLVKAFAAALGCSIRRIQFTPDLLPADITGTYVLNPRDATFSLRAGPIFTNVLLADEINRAPAKTQSALLEAMQERQVTIEGDRFELPEPFFVLATQNPIDLEGTYPLPEAQIDRFLVRVRMGYPNPRDEVAMLRAHGVSTPEPRSVLSASDVLQLQSVAARVHVEEDLYDYAVQLSAFTRSHPRVVLGASPRASLGLLRAAKAAAVVAGRPFATPDDVRGIAVSVLAHRLVLVAELESESRAPAQIVEEAIAKVGYRRAVRPVGPRRRRSRWRLRLASKSVRQRRCCRRRLPEHSEPRALARGAARAGERSRLRRRATEDEVRALVTMGRPIEGAARSAIQSSSLCRSGHRRALRRICGCSIRDRAWQNRRVDWHNAMAARPKCGAADDTAEVRWPSLRTDT